MRPSKAHFVTSCQQVLALGAVLAVLTPAASVVSLDVVETPDSPTAVPYAERQPEPGALPGAERSSREAGQRARVPVAPVEPVVTEVPLTGADARHERDGASATPERVARETEQVTRTTVLSEPQPVTGYGAVGVTWSHDEQVEDDRIELQVRTATGRTWTGWSDLEYHDEHAPDPGSEEDRTTRPGTDPLFVGEVDRVQLRAVARDGLPDDMSLAVVGPGRARGTVDEAPALAPEEAGGADTPAGPDAIELQAASTSAPRPTIFTRQQWGADERLRDGRPSYGTISAGFVHHTVNANAYARDDVPGILRSIYAYHTRSRGWSDIGYNFLVDRFGRIWEGRYGGVARPVVGAHTLGYNDDSFAMSAIGNFETVRPTNAMLRAYGRLFAWKLGLHGIDPKDRTRNVSGTRFAAINGHRDAGSTACPGRFLYAKLPTIRTYADEVVSKPPTPAPVTLGQAGSDLASTGYPDLVVRRASDRRGMILPTGGLTEFESPVTLDRSGWGGRAFLVTADLTGDDRPDLVVPGEDGLAIRPGVAGGFGPVARQVRRFRGHGLVASPGDLDGDGRADLVARGEKRTLVAFLQNSHGGFRPVAQQASLRGYRQLVGAGDVTGDGRPDLWGRDRHGRLLLNRGLGEGRFAGRVRTATEYADLAWLVGGTDYTGDAVPDLIVKRASGALLLLPSRGDGTLGRAIGPVGDGSQLTMISGAGQVVGNAAPDLVAAGPRGALVAVPNRGTFDVGPALDTGQSFGKGDLLLNAGDFDGDGHGDVIMRRKVGTLWLYRGRGTGRLADPQWIGSRSFGDVSVLRVVADVTGDERPDLVGRLQRQTWVWPSRGAAKVGERAAIEVAAGAREEVAGSGYDWRISTTDLQGRGAADLVVRNRDGQLFRLDGKRRGYRAPRYLGEARGYDLAG